MAEGRKRYTVTIAGVPHTLLLTTQAAKAYGDAAVEVRTEKAAPRPSNKSRTPNNK